MIITAIMPTPATRVIRKKRGPDPDQAGPVDGPHPGHDGDRADDGQGHGVGALLRRRSVRSPRGRSPRPRRRSGPAPVPGGARTRTRCPRRGRRTCRPRPVRPARRPRRRTAPTTRATRPRSPALLRAPSAVNRAVSPATGGAGGGPWGWRCQVAPSHDHQLPSGCCFQLVGAVGGAPGNVVTIRLKLETVPNEAPVERVRVAVPPAGAAARGGAGGGSLRRGHGRS